MASGSPRRAWNRPSGTRASTPRAHTLHRLVQCRLGVLLRAGPVPLVQPHTSAVSQEVLSVSCQLVGLDEASARSRSWRA